MVYLRALICTLFLTPAAWAGGELPFPFNQEGAMPVMATYAWTVENTNLSVQLKVYQDTKDTSLQWIKLWIRSDDGFVWVRVRQQNANSQVHRAVIFDTVHGHVDLDLLRPVGDTLFLEGERFKMVRQ